MLLRLVQRRSEGARCYDDPEERLQMAQAYDPLIVPDSDDWQSMDEDERIMLVMAYHQEAGVDLPNEKVHAVVHVVVENQVALGNETAAQGAIRFTLGELGERP